MTQMTTSQARVVDAGWPPGIAQRHAGHQARHVHHALVHRSAQAAPGHQRPQRGQPLVGRRRRQARRVIDDAAFGVVHQRDRVVDEPQ